MNRKVHKFFCVCVTGVYVHTLNIYIYYMYVCMYVCILRAVHPAHESITVDLHGSTSASAIVITTKKIV